MANILIDTFSGTGVLNGRTPDTTFSSQVWASATGAGGVTQSAGGVTSTTQTNVASVGSASIGTAGADYGTASATTITGTIVFVTGANVGIEGSTPSHDRRGFTLEFSIGAETVALYVDGANSGSSMDWTMFSTWVGSSAITLAANTTYTGTYSITSGAISFTMFGVTLSGTGVFTTPSEKFSRLGIAVGASVSLSEVTVATPVAVSSGSAVLTAPMQTLVARGGGFSRPIAPAPVLTASGQPAVNTANLAAPRPTLSAYAGANAKLTAPSASLVITGTFTNYGTAALAAPLPTLAATGKVSAVAGAALTAPMAKLVGYFGSVASVSVTGKATLTASGTTGSVGRATLTAPLFELTSAATRQNSGSAILTAPVGRLVPTGAAWLIAPGATLTAIGTAVVAVSYEAYALNLKHNPTPGVEPVDELTRYTNYPFDRIVRYKNSYFGMNSTGLYLLEGTTDFATPTPTEVPWSYKTALMDMKSVQLKNVSMAYFGGRMGPAATVSVYVGEASVAPYNYTTPRDATAQNYRQPLGKGLKSRYYAFGASGTGELTLDTLSLDVAVLARKV